MFELNSKMNDDRIDELGENHVATSAENPIRPDAFDISNEEKIAKIQDLSSWIQLIHFALARILHGSCQNPVLVRMEKLHLQGLCTDRHSEI